jgi:hypothetical protein
MLTVEREATAGYDDMSVRMMAPTPTSLAPGLLAVDDLGCRDLLA